MVTNLEYYRTFYYVVTLGSFTKAADLLCVSQSAVSQSVRKLEKEVNCRLLERQPGAGHAAGLHLTAEGETLFGHVKRALQEIAQGEAVLAQLTSGQPKELVVGATETFIRFYMPEALKAFRKENPGIHVTFKGATTPDLCKLLEAGEVEMAFLISPVPEQYHFELQKIGSLQDVPMALEGLPGIDFAHTYHPAELTQFPLILSSPGNTLRSHLDQWFLQDGAIPVPDYTVQSTGQIPSLVLAGLGIGILPLQYMQKEIQDGRVLRILTTTLPSARDIFIATRTGAGTSANSLRFGEIVREQVHL